MAHHPLSSGRLAIVAGLLACAFAGNGVAAEAACSTATSSAQDACEITPAAASASARSYSYETLDYPGAALTILWGIDDLGRLTGQYANAGESSHAMIYRHGKFEALEPELLGQYFSAAGGPNDAGTTFGAYADAAGLQHGYLIRKP